ncbi:hypothetical protein, partial [Delftia acidovorans]|uniref:hypothetical protein n=1 Tax=Delftia acidovorans TaxID=80866 RepID=UPI001ED964B5
VAQSYGVFCIGLQEMEKQAEQPKRTANRTSKTDIAEKESADALSFFILNAQCFRAAGIHPVQRP